MTLEELEKRVRALEALEKKVRTLEDTEEIKRLTRHYVNCLRIVRWDEIADCFTEDATVDIGFTGPRRGRAEIARLFKEEISKRHIGKEYVFVVHPIIKVSGDKATGSWLLYFMFTESEIVPVLSWTQGPYYCEYIREGGRWGISYLKWRPTLGPKPVKLMELYSVQDE